MTIDYYVHPSSVVSPGARIGEGTKIWQNSQVREDVVIGSHCIISMGVYIDAGVQIGSNVKIQNGISIYHGVTLEDGVFCGPHCVFTNDKLPRAINPDGSLKGGEDWAVSETLVRRGASIGANATIVCGVEIGEWAMVAAGAVVTKNVPDHGLVVGNPARLFGFVCYCGHKLTLAGEGQNGLEEGFAVSFVRMACPVCGSVIAIPKSIYQKIK